MWRSRLTESPRAFRNKKLKESFDLFDPDSEGFISPLDVEKAMLSLGVSKFHPSLNTRINTMTNNKQMVNFQTFQELLGGYNPSDSLSDIESIFKRFDFGNKGFINADDLRKVAAIIGETMTDKEINDLLCVSPNNEVGFEEFYKVLTKRSFGFY